MHATTCGPPCSRPSAAWCCCLVPTSRGGRPSSVAQPAARSCSSPGRANLPTDSHALSTSWGARMSRFASEVSTRWGGSRMNPSPIERRSRTSSPPTYGGPRSKRRWRAGTSRPGERRSPELRPAKSRSHWDQPSGSPSECLHRVAGRLRLAAGWRRHGQVGAVRELTPRALLGCDQPGWRLCREVPDLDQATTPAGLPGWSLDLPIPLVRSPWCGDAWSEPWYAWSWSAAPPPSPWP